MRILDSLLIKCADETAVPAGQALAVDREKFSELISKCDILITHGGVGSIITGLQNNKKVIVAPRLAKYNEHMNDHQIQITENFSKNCLSFFKTT